MNQLENMSEVIATDDVGLELSERRYDAAVLSGGTSSNAIYDSIESQLQVEAAAGRIVDYGAGVGELSRRLCRQPSFENVVGIDILPRPDDLPERLEWTQHDLNRPLGCWESQFDVVASAEVIEHLENPFHVAREWYRLLCPGGLLVMSTPNNESLRSWLTYLMKGHFSAFGESDFPAHITALLRVDISRCLTLAGFEPPRFAYVAHGSIPKLTRVSWQQLTLGRFRGRLFSDNIIAVARKPAE